MKETFLMHKVLTALLAGSFLAACGDDAATSDNSKFPMVPAVVETDPVDTGEDAADDMAIWVHPTHAERSVVIGTAKKSGIFVYDLDGKTLQFIPAGRLNNVDIRDAVVGGSASAILAASDRTNKAITLFRLRTGSGTIQPLGDPIPTGYDDPYGICLYRSAGTGDLYAFATNKEMGFGQWRLDIAPNGTVSGEKVRDLDNTGQSEGCVADDAAGIVYLAEENRGVWKFGAEPDATTAGTEIITLAGNTDLAADLEGVTLYRGAGMADYLIVSSQGNNSYAVFDRAANYAYLGSFAIGGGDIDGTSETDGIDVTSTPLGDRFPAGMFVVQDGVNTDPAANQNFKFVSWADVVEALSLK